jgi:hypothetical protein
MEAHSKWNLLLWLLKANMAKEINFHFLEYFLALLGRVKLLTESSVHAGSEAVLTVLAYRILRI